MQQRALTWGRGSIGERITIAAYDAVVEREWLARPLGRAVWGTDTRLLFDNLQVLGALPDGAAVLDIPCGGGVALRGLRPGRPVRYVAADLSAAMLARARRRAAGLGLDGLEFTEADIHRMPFADAEFDLCVSFNGLHCLPDPATAVTELARCLKPGGRLVGDSVVRGAGRDLLIGAYRRVSAFGTVGTPDELHGWFGSAGLSVESLQLSGAIAHFSAVKP
jgi:SAM-dependent methyltransferase